MHKKLILTIGLLVLLSGCIKTDGPITQDEEWRWESMQSGDVHDKPPLDIITY